MENIAPKLHWILNTRGNHFLFNTLFWRFEYFMPIYYDINDVRSFQIDVTCNKKLSRIVSRSTSKGKSEDVIINYGIIN